ncbi:MAG: uroporphyrinogen decarboxylase family protein [Oscillospiraceae bacterium]|nr:uroporphyrinogen decarboxylase family protein [Oscillospiraceae bacterium]
MIELKEQYRERTRRSREKISEVYTYKNREPAILVYNSNWWFIGEPAGTVPESYCMGDYDSMLKHQIEKIKEHDINDLNDCYEPILFPYYGVPIQASAFGAGYIISSTVDPELAPDHYNTVKNIDYIYSLKKPDLLKDGLCPRVLETIQYFKDNCDLPISISDTMGPLTVAIQLVGYENFIYWMYDEPEAIHLLMQMVTDVTIDWIRIQKRAIGVSDTEPMYQGGIRSADGFGGAQFCDDEAIILDPDSYCEFVKPYNEQVLCAFGGGIIHSCGDVSHQLDNLKNTKGLTTYNNYSLDNLDASAKLQKGFSEKNIVFMMCDYAVTDERMEAYYEELFQKLTYEGLIVTTYFAPTIALDKGKYVFMERNAAELGKRAYEIMRENVKKNKR